MTLIKIPIKNPSGYHPLSLTMRSSTSLLRPTPQLNKGQGSTPGHKVYLFKILINHSPVFLIWSCFIIYFRPLFILFLYQCCTPLYFFTHFLFLLIQKALDVCILNIFKKIIDVSVLKDFLAWILILFVCLSLLIKDIWLLNLLMKNKSIKDKNQNTPGHNGKRIFNVNAKVL